MGVVMHRGSTGVGTGGAAVMSGLPGVDSGSDHVGASSRAPAYVVKRGKTPVDLMVGKSNKSATLHPPGPDVQGEIALRTHTLEIK